MKKLLPYFHASLKYPVVTHGGFCLFILFLLINLNQAAYAQSIVWDKTIGGNRNDDLSIMQRTRDGGYILGGSSASDKSGDKSENNKGKQNQVQEYTTDYWIVKLNANGSIAWNKTFGGNNSDRLATLQQTQDGGYIVGGSSSSEKNSDKSETVIGEKNQFGEYYDDYWIIKLDASGNKEWDKTYGGDDIDLLVAIQQNPDGGYIVGGSSFSGVSGNKSVTNKNEGWFTDYWIVKLDARGNKIWDKSIGGNHQDWLGSLELTTDGGYILGGSSFSDKGQDKSEPNILLNDYWIVKLDRNGNKIWDKTYGGTEDEGDFSKVLVQQTRDGGYLVAGSSASDISGNKSENRRGFYDFWILKLNPDGTKVWDKTVGGNDWDQPTSLLQTPDGGYIVGGYSSSVKSGEKSENTKGYVDFWLVKLTANGTFISDKALGGVRAASQLASIQFTPDGYLMLGGTSDSNENEDKTQNSKGGSDYWLVKLNNYFKQKQTITFSPILNQEVGAPAVTLTAKASSGLPVTYRVVTGPAIINQNILTVTGPGNVEVEASQPGNGDYEAIKATQKFVITLTGKQAHFAFGSGKSDTLATMLATADGGYLLGGTSLSHSPVTGEKSQPGQGSTDFWVVKIGKNGQKQWDKTYGGLAAEKLTAMAPTTDGGYLLGGYSTSGVSGDKTQPGKGKNDYWLVKIDASGKLLWNQSYGGTAEDRLSALLPVKDGFLIGGSSASNASRDKKEASKGSNDYWILKINKEGQKLWDKTYGGSMSDVLAALIAVPEGGYLVGGSSASGVSGDKSQATRGYADYWVLRLNEQGDKMWDHTYGGVLGYKVNDLVAKIGRSILSSMVATPDGNFLLGGSSSAFPGAERTYPKDDLPYVTAEVSDYWLIKINPAGKKIWDKGYGAHSKFPPTRPGEIEEWHQTGNSELRTMLPLAGGGYLLGGTSNGDRGREKTDDNRSDIPVSNYDFSGDEFGSSVPVVTWNDYWIVKINEQGNKLEDRTLGGQRNDQLADVVLTSVGNFLLGGTSFSGTGADKNSTNRGGGDYWLVEVSNTKPQSSAWDASYNGRSNTDEKLSDVIKTADGGYLSGGTIDFFGDNNYWIVKIDKQGNMLWSKTYGGGKDDHLSRLVQTQDGGYLLAGTSASGQERDKSQPSQGGKDYWIIKIDARGNKQWDQRYGGSGTDELRKVVQLPSGEYVLAGFSNSPANGDKSQGSQGGSDYWVIKISASGIKIWDKRYGGSLDETLGSFTPTLDGGFFLGGTSLSGKGGDKTEMSRGQSDYWVLKLDKNGNILWDKTYGGSGQDEAYSVGRGNNSNLFVAGHSTSPMSNDKSQNNQGGKDYWLITLDATGNKLWDKTFGGSQDDELRASSFTTDGGYILGGTSASGKSGDKTQASRGKTDYWAVKVDAQGNKQWDKRFGGNQNEDLHAVFETKDGGYLLGGSSISGISGDRSQYNQAFDKGFKMRLTYDFWLVKIAPDSLTTSQASRTATQSTMPAETTDLVAFTAYPNPFQEKVSIRFILPETQAATVRVLDNQGREIKILFQGEAKANQMYEVEWQADKQPAGMYLLQLQTLTGQQTLKLLLNK